MPLENINFDICVYMYIYVGVDACGLWVRVHVCADVVVGACARVQVRA